MVALAESSGITQKDREKKESKINREPSIWPCGTSLFYLQTVCVKKWTLAGYCLNTIVGRDKYLDFQNHNFPVLPNF